MEFVKTLKVVIKYVAHNEYLLRIIGCSLVLLVCFSVCCLRRVSVSVGCDKQPGVYIVESQIRIKFVKTLKVKCVVIHDECLL